MPTFAWKIVDGDSQVPNKAGRKPCDNEGYPGNWVLSFSTSFAPATWNRDGTVPLDAKEIYRGSYVQVHCAVRFNGQQANPGVYLNQDMIALAGHGTPINTGPNVSEAGFGGAPLPAGASETPVGGIPAQAAPPVAVAPVAGGAPPVQQPAAPHTQILTPPAPPA
jgi:hypothetical protein